MTVSSDPARFVAIDWSGALDPRAQRAAIVACVVETGTGGRAVTALAGGRDRQEVVAWLAGLAGDGVPTRVGLDFPFSYAIPFLDRLRMRDFPALLAHMASLAAADAFIDACGEWWQGCGGRRDPRTCRDVERLPGTQGAESPLRALRRANGRYGFVGARQVGKAAITGIAALAELKRRVPAVRVWPFEDPAGAPLVVAEIWPRLALAGVVKSDAAARGRHVRALCRQEIRLSPAHRQLAARSDHAIDALAAAVAMASGCWPLTERHRLPETARREGWILGVEPIPPMPAT